MILLAILTSIFVVLCGVILAGYAIAEFFWYHWLGDRQTYRKFRYNKRRTADVIPFVGIGIWLARPNAEILPFFQTLYCLRKPTNMLGDVKMPFRRYIIPLKPEIMEKILSSMQLADKGFEYRFIAPWLNEGLLLSKGSKWSSRRKMLTGAFHFKILEDFVDIFNEQSQIFVNKVKGYNGNEFELLHDTSLCTLDIICETAMGRKLNAQINEESSYIQAVYQITKYMLARIIRPYLYLDFVFRFSPLGRKHNKAITILHDFTRQVIKERKVEFYKNKEEQATVAEVQDEKDDVYVMSGKKRRLAFLDLLIEASDNGKVLSDDDIREEVDTFMFEGHDTTAMAITWTLYLLGCHPECQVKVHAELDEIFGDSDRPATTVDLTKMKYLEMCIKESLRLYPSVPAITRDVKSDTVLDGCAVGGKNSLLVIPYLVHRNPDIFPNPERFIPERFLPENIQTRHPYAYIPFSAGPRNCIGQRFAIMEEKIVTSTFLRHFKITPVTKRDEINILIDLIIRPQGGIKVKATPRIRED